MPAWAACLMRLLKNRYAQFMLRCWLPAWLFGLFAVNAIQPIEVRFVGGGLCGLQHYECGGVGVRFCRAVWWSWISIESVNGWNRTKAQEDDQAFE